MCVLKACVPASRTCMHLSKAECVHACIESLRACIENVHACIESMRACIESFHACIENVHACIESVHAYIESVHACNESFRACIESVHACIMCLVHMLLSRTVEPQPDIKLPTAANLMNAWNGMSNLLPSERIAMYDAVTSA